ncbi:hypothetical protein IWX92DRAFT_354336 [Phyllosticta citricarpa]
MPNEPTYKRNHNARAPPPGQGSITSFFGRPTAVKPVRTEDEQVADAIAFVREKKMRTAAGAIDKSGTWLKGVAERSKNQTQDRSHHGAAPPAPKLAVPGYRSGGTTMGKENQHIKPPFARPSFTSAKSLAAATAPATSNTTPAPSLSSHRVRTEPLRGRPLRRGMSGIDFAAHQHSKGRPYPFYSSSPPRDMAQGECDDDDEPVDVAREQQSIVGDEKGNECAVSATDAMLDVQSEEGPDDDDDDGGGFDDTHDALAPPMRSSPPPSLAVEADAAVEAEEHSPPLALHYHQHHQHHQQQQQQQQQNHPLSMHTTSIDAVNNSTLGLPAATTTGVGAASSRRPGRVLGLRRDAGAPGTGWVNRPFVRHNVRPREG